MRKTVVCLLKGVCERRIMSVRFKYLTIYYSSMREKLDKFIDISLL